MSSSITNPLTGENPLLAVQNGLSSLSVTVNNNTDGLTATQSQLSTLTNNTFQLALVVGTKADDEDLTATQATVAGLAATVSSINTTIAAG